MSKRTLKLTQRRNTQADFRKIEMGTPDSPNFNEDQRQIQRLTFKARQMLCSINLQRISEGKVTDLNIAKSAINDYEKIIEDAESYLRERK